MNDNLWQYVAVFILLGCALAWIVYQLFSKRGKRRARKSCCGCSLTDVCDKPSEDRKRCDLPTMHRNEKSQ